jgi:hypothetical protein
MVGSGNNPGSSPSPPSPSPPKLPNTVSDVILRRFQFGGDNDDGNNNDDDGDVDSTSTTATSGRSVAVAAVVVSIIGGSPLSSSNIGGIVWLIRDSSKV